MQTIEMRKELTDEWKARGIERDKDYAILTNEMTKAWSGLSVQEYKESKGLKKENLRDNMTNIELVLNMLAEVTTENFIKELHRILKNGTTDARQDWFAVGDYKRLPNTVGDMYTTKPEDVAEKMKELLFEYNTKQEKTFDDLLDFHYRFECIHPFQDGNGRIGRLLLFKECLKYNIVPFIIDEELKLFYYRGLKEWKSERGYLRDTCLAAQDKFKLYLNYFKIKY